MRRRGRGALPSLGIYARISRGQRFGDCRRIAQSHVSARRPIAGQPYFECALRRRRCCRHCHRPFGSRSTDPRYEELPLSHSFDAMGFDLKESGFHIVLSKDVPQLIREKIKSLVSSFLGRHGLCREQISSFILHPGGQKLLVYMEEELGLSRADTQISWDVLCDYGNLSSASVLFVLHECLNKRNASAGEYGLLAAFGPGFSSEMLLLRWA